MPFTSTALKFGACCFLAACVLSKSNSASAQIIVYTNDTAGVLSSVATHVTADTLKRVNSAVRLSPPCTHGFSTKGFTNNTVFSDTMGAVQIKVAPAAGYNLKIDTFKADLRHSPTGPAKARFAYSVNNGATWIPQSTDQLPYASGTCDSMITCKWTVPVTVVYPSAVMFRIYGYNASVSTGTGNLQIMNLIINGTANSTLSTGELVDTEHELTVFPNPSSSTSLISYNLTNTEKVSLEVYNVLGQLISHFANNETQVAGVHTYSFDAAAPGMYYARLTVGASSTSAKFIKR